ncbi:DUF92 domain-containing protein [Halomarina litorea]|uniref:DUF92 domain-containing protein n=1 Tax=Halomarina litorea TaxID=2961595 RepID=UPI0020C43808|nr:DUF92 domain-containing protein [Halomarina sp. BCD28]
MSITVRRAGAFGVVALLALVAPPLEGRFEPRVEAALAAVPFALVALYALLADDEGYLFDVFARPGDFEEGRLYGLAGFSLAAAGLAIVALRFGMPVAVFVTSVFVLAYGDLAQKGTLDVVGDRFLAISAFAAAGFGAGVLAQFASALLSGGAFDPPQAVFLAASGALLAALLRSMLFERDDPLVMASVALVLWLFTTLPLELTATGVLAGVGVSVALGYVSYALETASVTGMLAGVLLALLSVVLGDFGWFAVLISFFAVGGLSTKFRYEEKRERGIAEDNEGARGSGNVLANSAAALVALVAAAASPMLGLPSRLFLFAFVGSVAAAMSDTLSSEIGGLYDDPRLITTLQRVPPGTDGGVTWQGELAGIAGAAVVAVIAVVAFSLSPLGVVVVVAAGVAGMTVDSLLGATVEGVYVDNKGVNFAATTAAAFVGGALAVATGLVVV